MFKEYLAYANDNPQGYWFKAKWYGWGWTPVTREGWLVLIGYLVLVLLFSLTIDEQSSTREVAFTFLLPVVVLTATLFRICWIKGERPHWNWGNPNSKK